MDGFELGIHRFNTEAFIDIRSVSIVLQRPTVSKAASGGKTSVDLPRPAQKFRIIELSSATTQFVQTSDGRQRIVQFQLLGLWDADIKIDDWWTDSYTGRDWLVGDIARSNEYESRALVVERGK